MTNLANCIKFPFWQVGNLMQFARNRESKG
jgi:hypothetical protein